MHSQNHFPKEKKSFLIPGPAGELELITTFPKEAIKSIVGVICHPHPLYEGTMHNKVVTTLARGFDLLGLPTIRFNFRGVGKSEGTYGDTLGETDDLLAVINWANQALPNHKLWLAGFSFGAYVAANVANQMEANQLISIAPPVNHFNFSHFSSIDCPWLVIHGDRDEVVPLSDVEEWAAHPPSPITFKVIKEASHFFHGKLIELREILLDELKNNLQK